MALIFNPYANTLHKCNLLLDSPHVDRPHHSQSSNNNDTDNDYKDSRMALLVFNPYANTLHKCYLC